MIRAEAHSDDMAHAVKFDAEPWFRQATDASIRQLFDCELGGDVPADSVAEFVGTLPGYEGIADMFDHVQAGGRRGLDMGFECHVHEPDALAWVKVNRPALYEEFSSTHYADRDAVDQMAVDTMSPPWDNDSSWTGPYLEAESSEIPSLIVAGRIEALERALSVATGLLMERELAYSERVSDVTTALGSVRSGDASPAVMDIINRQHTRLLQAQGAREPSRFKVLGFMNQQDLNEDRGVVIAEDMWTKSAAQAVGRNHLDEHPIVMVRSDDREFIQVLPREHPSDQLQRRRMRP